MNDLKQLAAITALNAMMDKGWLDICTIDQVANMMGVNPKGGAYSILRPLHCVHFDKMPAELRKELPNLIRQCLAAEPTFQFELPRGRAVSTVAISSPAENQERGILARLVSRISEGRS